MATVRKGDLAVRVSAKLGGTRAAGDQALDAVVESICESLARGERVVITGFGAFETRQVKERRVRAILGPQKGQYITVPAHKRVGFTPGSDLTNAVRK